MFFQVLIAIFCFASFSAFALDIEQLGQRYPWVDQYKYIEKHPDTANQNQQLQNKVEDLKKQIQSLMSKKEQEKNKANNNSNDLQTETPVNLTVEQEQKLNEDIKYIEANIDNLGPNLKALLLKRLSKFKALSE